MIPAPPALHSLPAGTRLVAGAGHATVLPDIDFETYSEAGFQWSEENQKWGALPGAPKGSKKGLFTVGAARYAEHPSTEVISCYYDLKDGKGARHWRPGMALPQDLFDHIARGGLLEAHNSGFEQWIWEKVCVSKYQWPAMPARQWRCSMAKCRAWALPGSLDMVGTVLNITNKKDGEGQRLIDKFSVPRNPTAGDKRKRLTIYDDPLDGSKFLAYNERDIVAEAEVSSMVPDLPPYELLYWQTDQAINHRGAHIDRKALRDCMAIVEQCLEVYNAELKLLTGGAVEKASELAKLSNWLRERGVPIGHGKGSTDEEAMEGYLKWVGDQVQQGVWPEEEAYAPYRALEIRQAVGSASVKKVFAMENQATAADRLHDLFTFQGARTGRPTGNGPQPTNLPSGGPEVVQCDHCGHFHGTHAATCPWCGCAKPANAKVQEWSFLAVRDALAVIASRSYALVEFVFGHALNTVGGCLRGLYTSAPGYDLISSDYSAIEAVVLAYLAHEPWRMEVFQTHGKIYEASASKMFGVPFEEFERVKRETGNHHHLRKKGKIGELGFGYQGFLGAAKQFGMPGTDEEIKADILAWRAASPNIEWFWGGQTKGKAQTIRANVARNSGHNPPWVDKWDKSPEYFGVEGAAVSAVLSPNVEFHVTRMGGERTGISYQVIGNVLYCKLRSGRRIAYHRPTLYQSERGGYGLSYWGYNTNPKNGPMGWICIDTWGGRLVENIVQATANDILRYASINLEGAHYPLVLHIYDEIVCEIPEGWGSLEEFERVMATMPPWAHDWPIKAAGGWRDKRYRKG